MEEDGLTSSRTDSLLQVVGLLMDAMARRILIGRAYLFSVRFSLMALLGLEGGLAVKPIRVLSTVAEATLQLLLSVDRLRVAVSLLPPTRDDCGTV